MVESVQFYREFSQIFSGLGKSNVTEPYKIRLWEDVKPTALSVPYEVYECIIGIILYTYMTVRVCRLILYGLFPLQLVEVDFFLIVSRHSQNILTAEWQVIHVTQRTSLQVLELSQLISYNDVTQ